MSLDRASSALDGVRYGATARFGDERGSFRELWRATAFEPIDATAAAVAGGPAPAFVQANLSISAPGVLRGLHLHRRQLDYWFVASGRAFTALVDVRPMLRGVRRPAGRDAGARGRRLGRDPDRRRAWVPRARAAPARSIS